MSGERSAIFEWVDSDVSRLPQFRWRCGSPASRPTPCNGGSFIDRLLLGLGVLMLAAGIDLSSWRANWHELGRLPSSRWSRCRSSWRSPPAGDIGLDSTPANRRSSRRRSSPGRCSRWSGRSTRPGADTYELFADWAVAIAAWVAVARLPALWLLWLALLHVAIFSVLRHVRHESSASCFGLARDAVGSVRLRHGGC